MEEREELLRHVVGGEAAEFHDTSARGFGDASAAVETTAAAAAAAAASAEFAERDDGADAAVLKRQGSAKMANGSGSGSPYRSPGGRRPFVPRRGDLMASRMRYYHSLSPSGDFRPPAHIVPEALLVRGVTSGENHMHGSWTTIFSIWNTMMGSSLLALPWGFLQAGLGVGFALIVVMGCISFYTARMVVVHGRGADDFYDLCKRYLGPLGQWLCWSASLLMLLGALMAYAVLMSDSLYLSVNGVNMLVGSGDGSPGHWWNERYVSVLIAVLLFPLCCLKNFSILVKLNTAGVFCMAYIMLFIVSSCVFHQGLTLDFVGWTNGDGPATGAAATTVNATAVVVASAATPEMLPEVALGTPHFTKLAGILSLSFFIHNVILPILKHQRHPEHNSRDLAVAYLLVAASYGVIGAVGFLAYNNLTTEDFLYVFSTTNVGAIVARLSLLFQLFSVFPLLLCIMRIQFFGLLWDSQYPGATHVAVFNLVCMASSTLVAIYYPHIGDILRFTGAIGGFIYIYMLPISVHLIKMYRKNNHSFSGMLPQLVGHGALCLVGVALVVGQFVQ